MKTLQLLPHRIVFHPHQTHPPTVSADQNRPRASGRSPRDLVSGPGRSLSRNLRTRTPRTPPLPRSTRPPEDVIGALIGAGRSTRRHSLRKCGAKRGDTKASMIQRSGFLRSSHELMPHNQLPHHSHFTPPYLLNSTRNR